MRFKTTAAALVLISAMAACSSMQATSQPSETATTLSSTAPADPGSLAWWQQNTSPLKGQGQLVDKTYIVTVPRDDIWLQSELGDIPISAGISSKFYFWRCTCGLGKVIGEYVVTDYEANDVIDVLRSGQVTIDGMSPMLMNEKPHLLSIRFQAEGKMDDLVKTFRAALDWTGPMRSTTQPSAMTNGTSTFP